MDKIHAPTSGGSMCSPRFNISNRLEYWNSHEYIHTDIFTISKISKIVLGLMGHSKGRDRWITVSSWAAWFT